MTFKCVSASDKWNWRQSAECEHHICCCVFSCCSQLSPVRVAVVRRTSEVSCASVILCASASTLVVMTTSSTAVGVNIHDHSSRMFLSFVLSVVFRTVSWFKSSFLWKFRLVTNNSNTLYFYFFSSVHRCHHDSLTSWKQPVPNGHSIKLAAIATISLTISHAFTLNFWSLLKNKCHRA